MFISAMAGILSPDALSLPFLDRNDNCTDLKFLHSWPLLILRYSSYFTRIAPAILLRLEPNSRNTIALLAEDTSILLGLRRVALFEFARDNEQFQTMGIGA